MFTFDGVMSGKGCPCEERLEEVWVEDVRSAAVNQSLYERFSLKQPFSGM